MSGVLREIYNKRKNNLSLAFKRAYPKRGDPRSRIVGRTRDPRPRIYLISET